MIDFSTIPVSVYYAIAAVAATVLLAIMFAPSKKRTYKAQLVECQRAMWKLIDTENCAPIMIRLAWHDSGTFDKDVTAPWPAAGGANGSIRFDPEIKHGANAGLAKAVNYLKPLKAKCPLVSWADLMQMASATAVRVAGGPKIHMTYGRLDVNEPSQCAKEGNLPDGLFDKDGGNDKDVIPTAAEHLRKVFYRMGFNDQEIVALSGAHTVGRAFSERSGTTACGYLQNKPSTPYTNGSCPVRMDGRDGVGMKGGKSWTKKWLKFDNSYFTEARGASAGLGNGNHDQEELLWLHTDRALVEDKGFAPYFKLYAEDQGKFFEDYANAHKKLSELGSKFHNFD